MTAVYVGREKNDVKFTLEFSAEEFEAAIQKAYLKNRGKISVDGFRKGKAPRKIIEARYGSGIFFDEAIDSMLKEEYPKALDQLDIEPVDRPVIDFSDDEKIEQGKGFKMTVTVLVAPKAEIKNYKGQEVEIEMRKVPEDAVESRLASMQKRNARVIDSEAPANWDDTVVLDYKGFVGEEQFEGGTADNYSLVLGSNSFIPGFEAQLVGCTKGEEKDVVVTFPTEYHAEELAGKEAVFKCTVKEIKTEELPALDDEFAKDVSEFDTLDELKADILKKTQEEVDKNNKNAAEDAILEKLIAENPVEIPQVMIDDEADNMFNELAQQMQMQGIDMDMYCQYVGTTQEEMRKGYQDQAKKRIHGRLLLEAAADLEGVEADEESVDKELESIAEMYKMEKDQVKAALGEATLKMIRRDVRNRKAMDIIYASASVKEKKAEEKPAEDKPETEEKPAE